MFKYVGMILLIAAGLYTVIAVLDTLQGTSPSETFISKKVFFQMMSSEDYVVTIAYFLPVFLYFLYTRKGSS